MTTSYVAEVATLFSAAPWSDSMHRTPPYRYNTIDCLPPARLCRAACISMPLSESWARLVSSQLSTARSACRFLVAISPGPARTTGTASAIGAQPATAPATGSATGPAAEPGTSRSQLACSSVVVVVVVHSGANGRGTAVGGRVTIAASFV